MTTVIANKPSANPATKRPRRMARDPRPQNADTPHDADNTVKASVSEPAALKGPTKVAIIVGLLNRKEGATLVQMVETTGWLPHTTRAAMTGLKKKGHSITSTKTDGVRIYRILMAQQERSEASTAPKSTPDA